LDTNGGAFIKEKDCHLNDDDIEEKRERPKPLPETVNNNKQTK
jgi:hypothetical protein